MPATSEYAARAAEMFLLVSDPSEPGLALDGVRLFTTLEAAVRAGQEDHPDATHTNGLQADRDVSFHGFAETAEALEADETTFEVHVVTVEE